MIAIGTRGGRRKEPLPAIRDEAERNAVVEANMGLVYGFIEPMLNRGVSYEDLMQEGFLGLVRAAELWEPERGEFSTCAAQWIRHFARRAVDKTGVIRSPGHAVQDYYRVMRLIHAGRGLVSFENACDTLGLSESRIEMVEAVMRSRKPVYSVEDWGHLNPRHQNGERHKAVELANEILDRLPKPFAETLKRYYGIGQEPESYTAIAASRGVSWQAAQQMATRAIKRAQGFETE